jgi:esterase
MKPVPLAFEEFGTNNPLPFLILHGFFASSRNWRLISEKLGETYHVFVPDMRNHGASPHSASMDYPSMAGDILAFMDQHHLESAHILGHSMGGKIAMWLSLNHAERIKKLIVVDIAPKNYNHSFNSLIESLMTLPLADISNRKQAETLLADAIPQLSYRQFLLQNLVLEGGRYRWRIDLPIFRDSGPYIAGFPDTEDTPAYNNPALFIAGGKSDYVEPSDLLPLFPHAKYVSIPDGGHWLHAEKTIDFIEVVETFLQTES